MSEPNLQTQALEMFQKMLNPSGFPLQSLLLASLDSKELEKKIAELKTVEQWLTVNLNMLQLTIKTLEYQKALLSPPEPPPGPAESSPAASGSPLWPWNMMAESFKPATPAMPPSPQTAHEPTPTPKPKRRRRPPGTSPSGG